MAKKPTASKNRKPAKSPNRRATRTVRLRPAAAETASLSVTDGAMKDVIRAAFLRRES